MLQRDYEPALDLLRQIDDEDLPDDLRSQYRSMMTQCLADVIRSDFNAHQAELDELGKFAERDDERLLYRRLRAEALLRRGEHTAAFSAYWKLAEEYPHRHIVRGDQPETTVRLDVWVAGKLAGIWEALPAEDRASLDARMTSAAEQALQQNRAAQQQFVTLFPFHSASAAVESRLAADATANGHFARAESRLLSLSRRADAQAASEALQRLVGLLEDFDLTADADHYSRLLHQNSPAAESDGLAQRSRSAQSSPSLNWGSADLKLHQMGSRYNSSDQVQELHLGGRGLPFFEQHWFQIDPHQGRLEMVRAAEGTFDWLLPLQSQPGTAQDGPVTARSTGHRVVLLHRDVLHCISPVDRRLLWTHPIQSRSQASGDYRAPSHRSLQTMQAGTGLLAKSSLRQQARRTGMLAAVGPGYVCVYGRRSFTVLDGLTGEVRWRRDGLPAHTTVYGTDDVLYVVPPDDGQAVALSALDGKRLEISHISALLEKAVYSVGNALVLMEPKSGQNPTGRSREIVLRRTDPLSDRDGWRVEFPRGTYFSLVEEGQLAVLQPAPDSRRQLATLDLATGDVRRFEPSLSESQLESQIGLYVLAGNHRVYMLINKRRQGSYYYSTGGLPSLRINGPVVAFDRQTGKRLWTETLKSQALIYPRRSRVPFLIFTARTYVREQAVRHWSLKLVALDKQTGRRLIDTELPVQSSFRTMIVNRAERYVELRSFNQRLRLTAVDRNAPASE